MKNKTLLAASLALMMALPMQAQMFFSFLFCLSGCYFYFTV